MRDFRFVLLSAAERILAEFMFLPTRLLYMDRISVPAFRFGGGMRIRIRSGGIADIGKVSIRRNFTAVCDGGRLTIEDHVFINDDCSINCMQSVSIGSGTMLGAGVRMYDHDHARDEDGRPSRACFETAAISIGRGCWIGAGVTVLKGVSICDGVTIGSGAVVTKSIRSPGVYVSASAATLKCLSA